MYHTHLHDERQLPLGLYGPMIVVDDDQAYQPAIDHVVVVGRSGVDPAAPDVIMPVTPLVINGETAPVFTWKAGARHRVRLINITPDDIVTVSLQNAQGPVTWTPVAKDGAPLPAGLRQPVAARQTIAVGETYDFEIDLPPGRRTLWLEVRTTAGKWEAQGQVIVEVRLRWAPAKSRPAPRRSSVSGCSPRSTNATRIRRRDRSPCVTPAPRRRLRRLQTLRARSNATPPTRPPGVTSHSPVCRPKDPTRPNRGQAAASARAQAMARAGPSNAAKNPPGVKVRPRPRNQATSWCTCVSNAACLGVRPSRPRCGRRAPSRARDPGAGSCAADVEEGRDLVDDRVLIADKRQVIVAGQLDELRARNQARPRSVPPRRAGSGRRCGAAPASARALDGRTSRTSISAFICVSVSAAPGLAPCRR